MASDPLREALEKALPGCATCPDVEPSRCKEHIQAREQRDAAYAAVSPLLAAAREEGRREPRPDPVAQVTEAELRADLERLRAAALRVVGVIKSSAPTTYPMFDHRGRVAGQRLPESERDLRVAVMVLEDEARRGE